MYVNTQDCLPTISSFVLAKANDHYKRSRVGYVNIIQGRFPKPNAEM